MGSWRQREGVLHPAWWLSLFVLVLNDHVLKSAAVLPGWLTGKLSDFAGLVVAPVCLVTVLRLRRRWPRAIAFIVVGTAFAALQLSPALAQAAHTAAAWFGWPCRIWPDPTDLIALPMLVLAWRIAPPKSAAVDLAAPRQRSSRLPSLAAMGGAVACLASSSVCPQLTACYLVNTTREDLPLEVYRAVQPIDCDAVERDPMGQLPVDSFEQEESILVSPFDLERLDDDHSLYYAECDAVLLRGARIPDSILFWRESNRTEILETDTVGEGLDSNAVYIEQVGDELILSADAVRVWPVE